MTCYLFLFNLKNFIDGFLKSEDKSKITLSGKDDFINILCHLATSKDLKILWRTVLSKIAKKDISPSVETFLYKEVVTFFSKPEPKKLLRDMFI